MGFLARQPSQEVQLRPADMCMPLDDNFIDARRVDQKRSFDADPVAGGPADGEIGIIAALPQSNHGAFELLDAFSIALFDPNVYADLITRKQLRDVFVFGGVEIFFKVNHRHFPYEKLLPCGAGRDYIMPIKIGKGRFSGIIFQLPA